MPRNNFATPPAPIQQAKPQQSAREARRASLLDIAKSVFLEKGYESTTINDILAAAKLSKGGFYHHFTSKAEVLDALRNSYTRWFIETVEAKTHTVPVQQIEKRFQAWVYAYVEAYFATYTVHDLVYHSLHPTRASNDRVAIIKSLEHLLEEGNIQGAWVVSSPSFIAAILYSAIHGITDDAIVSQNQDVPAIAEKLTASLRLLLQ